MRCRSRLLTNSDIGLTSVRRGVHDIVNIQMLGFIVPCMLTS